MEGIRNLLSSAQDEMEKMQWQRLALLEELKQYHVSLGVGDTDALLQVVERARERKVLRTEMSQLEKQLVIAGDGYSIEQLQAELEQAVNSEKQLDDLPEQILQCEEKMKLLEGPISDAVGRMAIVQKQLRDWDGKQADAASKAQEAEFHLAEVDRLWNEYVRTVLARKLLARAVEEFRERNESTILGRASSLFARLTLGRYSELAVEYDDSVPYLEAVTVQGGTRRVHQLSDGTRDQLYLALRLAFVEQYVNGTDVMPVVLDDILVHFDDERAAATLEVLLELSEKTQVLYFTHHKHIAAMVLRMAGQGRVRLHELGKSPVASTRVGIQ